MVIRWATRRGIDWGDGSTITVIDPAAEHTCAAAGVYTLTVSGAGGAGDSRAPRVRRRLRPEGGFVTGGGWIDSPAGAYALDPGASTAPASALSGATAGRERRRGGRPNFQFRPGELDFRCTVYGWLLASGPKAQFKGSGSVNGLGGFGFLLTPTTAPPAAAASTASGSRSATPSPATSSTTTGAATPTPPPPAGELGGGGIVIHDNN